MRILLLNQCFYPDVVSTAQHTGDLACLLAERGHEVTVIASSRGYDNPALRFPARERWRGVEILRVPCLATGKGKRWKRAANIASFFLTCSWRMLLMRRFDVVVALTSPPLISALGALFTRIAGGRFVFWVMDLNPDEAIAAGWLREGSRTANLLESVLRYSAERADRILVLDRFMRERMAAKGIAREKLSTLPPWSHDNEVRYDAAGRAAFRERHGLAGKFVVMYSGNHSPCHPLDTVLEAARQMALANSCQTTAVAETVSPANSESHEAGPGRPVEERDIAFCFVGGGSEYGKVREFAARHGLANIVCLPYQPLSELSASLSAADLHLVAMGAKMTGLVHPCKIYNVLALGIPVLYVGPEESHVADIAAGNPEAPILRAGYGDAHGTLNAIRLARTKQCLAPDEDLRRAAGAFSVGRLAPLYCEAIETAGRPGAMVDWGPAAVAEAAVQEAVGQEAVERR